jgi:hypothetical protein
LLFLGVLLSSANGQEAASEVIAAQIRTQGYQCDDPQRPTHDRELSKPNQQVWVLRCSNATDRVKLIPRMAAQVEAKPLGEHLCSGAVLQDTAPRYRHAHLLRSDRMVSASLHN